MLNALYDYAVCFAGVCGGDDIAGAHPERAQHEEPVAIGQVGLHAATVHRQPPGPRPRGQQPGTQDCQAQDCQAQDCGNEPALRMARALVWALTRPGAIACALRVPHGT